MKNTLTVMAKQLRGPGDVYSGVGTVPARVAGETIIVSPILGAADLADATLQFVFNAEWSTDGGATWKVLAGMTCQCGKVDKRTGAAVVPAMEIDMGSFDADGNAVSALAGKQVRAHLVLPRQLSVGVQLTA